MTCYYCIADSWLVFTSYFSIVWETLNAGNGGLWVNKRMCFFKFVMWKPERKGRLIGRSMIHKATGKTGSQTEWQKTGQADASRRLWIAPRSFVLRCHSKAAILFVPPGKHCVRQIRKDTSNSVLIRQRFKKKSTVKGVWEQAGRQVAK